jgi:hypothetical protein
MFDISSHEYAEVARWFSENIPGACGQVEKWLGGMPLVHAFTLVAHRRKAGDFKKMRPSSERGMEQQRAVKDSLG